MDTWRRTCRTFIKLELGNETLGTYLRNLEQAGAILDARNLFEIMIQILSGVCDCHQRDFSCRNLT